MSGAQQPVVIQVVRASVPQVYDSYPAKAARILGILQIALAVASITFSIASICLRIRTAYTGYGIISAILWIIAGSFGIASASRKSACTIITTLVLSVLAAVGMGTYLTYASLQVVKVAKETEESRDMDGCGCFEEYDEESGTTQEICVKCAAGENKPFSSSKMAVSSLLLIIGLAELVVAISASALGCHAACCCRRQGQVIQNAGQNNQVLMVNTEHGQQTIGIPQGYQIVAPVAGNSEKQTMTGIPQHCLVAPPPYVIDNKN